jgi:hypothetical protein
MGIKTRISPIPIENSNVSNVKDLEEIPENKKNDSLAKKILANIFRIVGLLCCLYFFVISLDLMSSGFRLIAGLMKFKYTFSWFYLILA